MLSVILFLVPVLDHGLKDEMGREGEGERGKEGGTTFSLVAHLLTQRGRRSRGEEGREGERGKGEGGGLSASLVPSLKHHDISPPRLCEGKRGRKKKKREEEKEKKREKGPAPLSLPSLPIPSIQAVKKGRKRRREKKRGGKKEKKGPPFSPDPQL